MDADEVIDYLVPEADERAVLSAILKKSSKGLELVAASLVIGPEEMARSSWPTWRHMSGDTISRPDDHHSEFAHDLPNWVVGRTHAPISEARSWLDLAMNGAPPAMGSIPASTASLIPATAPIQVFPKTDSPTCQLVTGTVRPITGFLFKGIDGGGCEGLDWQWEISGQLLPNAPYELLGIFVSGDDHPSPVPAPKGLLVGRLARRAWLIELRGTKDPESFEAHVGIDEDRIHITDLEVEYEERDGSDVIINQRIRLEDVPITESGPNMCVVLPTIGTKVAHGARLRDRDGVLLDMTDSHYLLEHVSIKMIAGGKEGEISVGERRLQPSLVERASRVKEVTEQYRKWFEAGIDGRVFDNDKLARDALVKHLQASRGPLSVSDPYFGGPNKAGSAERDWSLLRGLNRPIRLLTSDEAHPVGASPSINLLEARKWIGKKPPFHDRFYLWDEGGLNVGTSPNGFGGRLFRMQRLGAVEAASLQLRFDAWWSSGDVTTV